MIIAKVFVALCEFKAFIYVSKVFFDGCFVYMCVKFKVLENIVVKHNGKIKLKEIFEFLQ